MATMQQRWAFNEELFGSGRFLDDAISWIRNNLSPVEVFGTAALEEWATDNDWVLRPLEE
ncbi:MAG TPA: hypothetical protein DCQ64_30275 [Candidatus Rokubacteria bacterium]|nr:hypothetical protein [Candidatus Rokubacteria bacterium]